MTVERARILQMDARTGQVVRTVVLQYNPDSLQRTLQPQGATEGGDPSEALRLRGPPVETIKLEAELDAADQLADPDRHPAVAKAGLGPHLAALELLAYPPSASLEETARLAARGTLEIFPAPGPLTVLSWGPHRMLPVRITEFSITEEAFDARLNPIRAKVSLGLRVLGSTELGLDRKGGAMALAHHRHLEEAAKSAPRGGTP